MAEVRWLEQELARELCPVAAPDALWDRIHEQRRPLRVMPNPLRTWSIAAAALLMLLAGLVWRLGATRDPAADLEAMAARELRGMNGSRNVDLRSGDPAEIRSWVQARLGIDVRLASLPLRGDAEVRLLGARLLRSRQFAAAAIDYRVGDDLAVLVVTERHATIRQIVWSAHTPLRYSTTGNIALYSWSLGAADYAIAFGSARQPRRGCLLCHADLPATLLIR